MYGHEVLIKQLRWHIYLQRQIHAMEVCAAIVLVGLVFVGNDR
jgi:hypothetical protein